MRRDAACSLAALSKGSSKLIPWVARLGSGFMVAHSCQLLSSLASPSCKNLEKKYFPFHVARKKKTTHGVSFPDPELLTAAKAKAASMQISFSTYINQLVR